MNKKINSPGFKIKLDYLIVLIYLIVFSIRFFSDIPKNISGILYFASGCICLIYCYCQKSARRKKIRTILFIDAISCIVALMNGNNTIVDALYVIAAQAFGFLLYKQKNKIRFTQLILGIIFLYVAFRVFFIPDVDRYGDICLSPLCGKNTVSIIMMFSFSVDLIYRKLHDEQPNYFYVVIGILCSFITDSSGGILGFAMLGIGIFCCKNREKLAWRRIVFYGSFGILILMLSGQYVKIIDFFSDDNSRFAIWKMYLSLADNNFKSVLLGADISQNHVLYHLFNIHNNFLNWHCYFGLIPFIAYSVILIYIASMYIKRKDWYMLVIWIALFVRSLTDGTDFCFMSIWMYMYLDVNCTKMKIRY